MPLTQPRPAKGSGITEMHIEVKLLGATLPIEADGGGLIKVQELEGFVIDRHIGNCARTCYQTNDKTTPEADAALIRKLVKSGHTSVFEHVSISFMVRGGSRAFTHQLVRHRNTAYSQESQRYCDQGDIGVIVPPSIKDAGLRDEFMAVMERARKDYLYFQGKLNQAKAEGRISADYNTNEDARFVLPNGVQSEIVFSPNMTELRSMFLKRLSSKAQWEIKAGFAQILEEVVKYTHVFDDIYEYYHAHGEKVDGFTITF